MIEHRQVNKLSTEFIEQMAQLTEYISDGFFAVGKDQTIICFNKAAERLLGKTKSVVLDRNLFDVFYELEGSVFEDKYFSVIQNRNVTNFETFFGVPPYKNWYNFTLTFENDAVLVYFQLPAEREWAEEALRKSEQYNKALLTAVPDQVLRLSSDGKCIDFHTSLDKPDALPGFLMGDHIDDVFPRDISQKYQANIDACLSSRQPQLLEYRLPLPAGPQDWIARMVLLNKQEVLVVARNVTEDKQAAVVYQSVLAAEREQRLIAETLAEVTLALTSQTSLKNVLDEVLRQTQRLVPYHTAHIMLLKNDYLRIAGWQGYRELGSEELVSHLVQPLADFPLDAEVVLSRQPLVIADTYQESRWVVQEQTSWVRSHMVVPICLGERVLGVLRLDANTIDAFSEQDLVKLQPLTNAAAIAMENARLFDHAQEEIAERRQAEKKIRRRNRELTLLNQIIAASVTAVEPEDILKTTCEELARAFEMPEVTATLLINDNTAVTVVAEYIVEGRGAALNRSISVEDTPGIQYLLEHKTPLVVHSIESDPRMAPMRKVIQERGLVSLLILPLVVENKVVGSLNLQSVELYEFSDQEINLAWRVAEQVAGVLARTQLDKEHRRLSAAIEQSAESVIITDTAGKILYVNPSFERITGYSRAEALGEKLNMLKSGKQDAAFYKNLWDTINAGKVWQGRFINKKKDGALYTDEATISPVRNESGAIVNYVGVQRDVTRELQLEEQYRQAQKMEAVGLLAGGVAHDFNNLLTVINGFAEMIQFEIPPDNLHLQKLAGRVRYSGTRAAALVRQLLAFSRKEYVEPEVLNLNRIVTDIGKMLERLIEENIVLNTDFSPDLWPVKVDAHQIEQIIVNLTVNARDAMPDGGRLTIETENKLLDDEYSAGHLGLEPGEYILLTVSDTGVGMSAEVKEHLFEPFFTTKKRGKGTGLGLATVFGIVQQYRGSIFVYSEPDKGTTFKIYLPRADEAENRVAKKEQPDGIPRGNERILVVEDEVAVRNLAAYMLRRQGYAVLEAANGEDALRLAKKQSEKIDLLLTDTVMPKMSGNVLADQFKKQYPNTKILFTSGYTDKQDVQNRIVKAGVDFIPKPFSAGELARKVRIVLDG